MRRRPSASRARIADCARIRAGRSRGRIWTQPWASRFPASQARADRSARCNAILCRARAHRSVWPNPRIQTIGFPGLWRVNNLPIERVGPSEPSPLLWGGSMIKIHTWPLCLAFSVALLAAATSAQAQTPAPGTGAKDTSNGAALEEVIVTAERRPEALKDAPVAVTVVNAEQLADQHVYNIAELAQTTPALEMIQAFGGPGGGGQIRGLGTQSFTRSAEGAVGIVVDGISQGNVNISNIFDVQHIEVLEGPQGTLFGLTSSAGVISILTNAPDPTGFHTNWHEDYAHKGTAGSLFGQETLQGVVNIPLSDVSALRVSASVDDNRGVEHNNFTGLDDTADNFGLRARYLFKASDAIQLNVIADWERTVQHGAEGGAITSFTYV